MDIEIKELCPEDEEKAIAFAVKGMHFEKYTENKWLLGLYGKYFWYLECNRATQRIAAYANGRFVGVLLAKMNGEDARYYSRSRECYVRMIELFMHMFFRGTDRYDAVNHEMLCQYLETNVPDGEIIFLASDTECGVKGIGSALLSELECREPDKQIYLYTDNNCTYPFYEHRGFTRMGERDIIIDCGRKKAPLRCFLYSKIL